MAQIRVKRGRVNYIMHVKNVSQSGLFIATDSLKQMRWFHVDQELEMDLFTAEDLDNIRVTGQIVRIADHDDGEMGFGVQFSLVDEEVRLKLQYLIDHAIQGSVKPPPLPK